MNKCHYYQKILLENNHEYPDEKTMNELNHHIAQCPDCRAFQKLILSSQSALNPEKEIQVADDTIKNLLQKEYAKKYKKENGILSKLKKLIQYKVPLYQVASVASILLFIIILAQNIQYRPSDSLATETEDSLYVKRDSEYNYLIENLDLTEKQKVGFSVQDDSLILILQQSVM